MYYRNVYIRYNDRIKTLDILRGIAVLGILAMNIFEMAYPKSQALDYKTYSSDMEVDYVLMFLNALLVSGKMRGMFSALFGITSLIIINRLQQKKAGLYAADIYFKRLIWLLLFGLFHAFILLWSCDILYIYAICGLFLFPLRKLSPVKLIAISMAFIGLLTFQVYHKYHKTKILYNGYEMVLEKEKNHIRTTTDEIRVKIKWDKLQESWKYDQEEINKTIETRRGNYISNFKLSARRTQFIESKGLYRNLFFDAMALMLLGMALYKWGFFSSRVKPATYIFVLIPALLAGLLLHFYVYYHYYHYFHEPLLFRKGMIFYPLGRIFMTLGYISLITLLCRLKFLQFIGNLFAHTGKMALTNYLMQTIIAIWLFYGFGAGLFAALYRQQVFILLLLIWVFQITFSVLWMKYFIYGPFEWAWRSLTYWKIQPFLKEKVKIHQKNT